MMSPVHGGLTGQNEQLNPFPAFGESGYPAAELESILSNGDSMIKVQDTNRPPVTARNFDRRKLTIWSNEGSPEMTPMASHLRRPIQTSSNTFRNRSPFAG